MLWSLKVSENFSHHKFCRKKVFEVLQRTQQQQSEAGPLPIYKATNHIYVSHLWPVSVLDSGQTPSADGIPSNPSTPSKASNQNHNVESRWWMKILWKGMEIGYWTHRKMALMALLMAVVFATAMMYFVFCHDGTLRKKRGYRKVVHFSDVDSEHQNLSEVQFMK